jgi:PDZ domain-containing protein
MEEANDNATVVAYQKAKENIKINKHDVYVTYVFPEAITDIEAKDKLISINDITFNDKQELDSIIDSFNVGDTVSVKVINDGKEKERKATIQCEDEDKYIGLYITQDIDYEVERNIKFKVADNESGPSGGLMMALEIYNELIEEDLTKGYAIAGTGTLDINGDVGSISGIKYKLKSAEKENVKIFFVPSGENYEEAKELKEKYNYKIDVIPVDNIEDALNYLSTL